MATVRPAPGGADKSRPTFLKVVLEITVFVTALFLWYVEAMHTLLVLALTVGLTTFIEWTSVDLKTRDVGEMSLSQESTKEKRSPAPDVTIEEVRKHDQREDCWIVIDQKVYDVTSWAKSHPGGPLPLWGTAGRDATDHFYAFHPNGTEKWLPPLQVGNLVGYTPSETVRDFRAMRQRLIDQGFFKINRWYSLEKYVAFMCMLLAAIVCVLCSAGSSYSWCWTGVGGVLLAMFWQQMAGLGHDCGHNSLTHIRSFDLALGYAIANLLTGIGVGWWKKSHNTHHTVPNSVEYDPDIQHLPVFAVTEAYFEDVFSKYHDWTLKFDCVAKLLVCYQHVLYIIIMALARFNLYAQTLLCIFGLNSHSGGVIHPKIEFLAEVLFLSWLSGLCSLLPTWPHVVFFLLVSHGIAGLLHVQITISHFSMEKYSGRGFKDDTESWAHIQLATTMDVECPPYLDWFHIGLQYQIEHHLFPRIPRHNLRRVRDEFVMPWCEKHGIHHHQVPWFQSIGETLSCLSRVAGLARAGAH